jgi:hypothetical protein
MCKTSLDTLVSLPLTPRMLAKGRGESGIKNYELGIENEHSAN